MVGGEKQMKIIQKGPAESDVSKIAQSGKAMPERHIRDSRSNEASQSAKVEISEKARELHRVSELARIGDDLRTEKVRQLKEAVSSGKYDPDPEAVAESILRGEVMRLLYDKPM
jgi:flagellar biosynthesis anti-sigma factor FlgM